MVLALGILLCFVRFQDSGGNLWFAGCVGRRERAPRAPSRASTSSMTCGFQMTLDSSPKVAQTSAALS